jgi:hypothetical protein
MAACLIHLDRPVDARGSLERSLAYGVSALGADSYSQGLAYRSLLDGILARVTIECAEPGEEIRLDGNFVFEAPGVASRFVLPGEHQLVATKRGLLPSSRRIVVKAGQQVGYEIHPVIDPRIDP